MTYTPIEHQDLIVGQTYYDIAHESAAKLTFVKRDDEGLYFTSKTEEYIAEDDGLIPFPISTPLFYTLNP